MFYRLRLDGGREYAVPGLRAAFEKIGSKEAVFLFRCRTEQGGALAVAPGFQSGLRREIDPGEGADQDKLLGVVHVSDFAYGLGSKSGSGFLGRRLG